MANAIGETDHRVHQDHKIGAKIRFLTHLNIRMIKMRTGCRSQVSAGRKTNNAYALLIKPPFFSFFPHQLNSPLRILYRPNFLIDHSKVAGQAVLQHKSRYAHVVKAFGHLTALMYSSHLPVTSAWYNNH